MRWEIERYVKLYRRDTAEWKLVPWRAKGVFDELLRKCDLDGRIECGRLSPAQAIAVLFEAPREDVQEIEGYLAVLMADGCVQDVPASGRRGRHLLLPNYREAQGVALTGAERTAKWREEQKESAQRRPGDEGDGGRHGRHERHGAPKQRSVTRAESEVSNNATLHAKSPQADESDAVTDPAEPSRAEPSRAEQPRDGVTSPRHERHAAAADPLGEFRRLLADELAIASSNPLPVTKPERVPLLRRHLERLGVEYAVELCAELARDRAKTPRTADYFLDFLAEQETPIDRAPGENPKHGDPDFNDPGAWADYGDFLRRSDGKTWEQATGLKRPKYVPPKTPEEEAAERAAQENRT